MDIKVTVTCGASASMTYMMASIVDLKKNPPSNSTADDSNDGFRVSAFLQSTMSVYGLMLFMDY